MKHAAYLDESAEEMHERLYGVRDKQIGDLVDRSVKTANLGTPLIEALMLITSNQYVVPVVDKDNKLVGAISFFSVLYGLDNAYDREVVQRSREMEREARRLAKEEEEREAKGEHRPSRWRWPWRRRSGKSGSHLRPGSPLAEHYHPGAVIRRFIVGEGEPHHGRPAGRGRDDRLRRDQSDPGHCRGGFQYHRPVDRLSP